MSQTFSVPIEEVVDFLHLERNPRKKRNGAVSFDVKCPFCDDRGYHLNINIEKNAYHCVRCMDGTQKNTGVLDLYGRVALGVSLNSGNSKELYKSLVRALGKDKQDAASGYARQREKEEEYKEIEPESDEFLNTVYSALLSLPYLKLSDDHRANLISRGLSNASIRANGYATMCKSAELLNLIKETAPDAEELMELQEYYRKNHFAEIRSKSSILSAYSDEDIILGLKIASDVSKAIGGHYPMRVPGFYTIGEKWAFRGLEAGILIPTRNQAGLIVGIQTRCDEPGSLRYMTLSSKGLPSGVTVGIARTHFCGDEITPNTKVILTEGPLKSDAAYSLFGKLQIHDIAMIALQGVNSTRELPEIARMLKNKGVTVVRDGFDMDKLVNPFVLRAMKTAQRIFHENGDITLKPMVWDREYAERKAKYLRRLCAEGNIPVRNTDNVFCDLAAMSKRLCEHGIDYNKEEKWNPQTKGMDDYLAFAYTHLNEKDNSSKALI